MKLKNLLTTGGIALAISASANADEPRTLAPPTGQISATQSSINPGVIPLQVKVRTLGAAVTQGAGGAELPVQIDVRVGNTSATFTGVGSSVDPQELLIDTHFSEGQEITWRARINAFNLPYYDESSNNVRILRNGDPAPDHSGAFGQGSVVEFLAPYLKDGKISIGNRDLLYLSELGTTRTSSSAYDLQDAITLITFEKCNSISN